MSTRCSACVHWRRLAPGIQFIYCCCTSTMYQKLCVVLRWYGRRILRVFSPMFSVIYALLLPPAVNAAHLFVCVISRVE